MGSIDGEAFAGGEARDQLIELGSGNLVPGFEDQLRGSSAGDEKTITITFPDDYGAEDLRGRTADFAVTVNEIKRKQLPELDDEFASDAAGFDTIDELREDVAKRMREADESRVEGEFREAVLDAAVREATVEVPETLVEARARELWDRMLHPLGHQGINRDMYLRIANKSEEEILDEARPDAEQALRREAVLAAVIEAEGIEPADGDVLDALQATAARENTTPEKLRDRLEKAGRLDELRDDLAQRQAIDLLPPAPSRSPSSRPRRATSCGRPARRSRRARPADRSCGPLGRDASPEASRQDRRSGRSAKRRLVGSPEPPPSSFVRRQESAQTSETERGP